jgi:hypothetical protein
MSEEGKEEGKFLHGNHHRYHEKPVQSILPQPWRPACGRVQLGRKHGIPSSEPSMKSIFSGCQVEVFDAGGGIGEVVCLTFGKPEPAVNRPQPQRDMPTIKSVYPSLASHLDLRSALSETGAQTAQRPDFPLPPIEPRQLQQAVFVVV